MKTTIVELFALAILSLVLAFGVNAVRLKGSIKLTHNYFERSVDPAKVPGKPASESTKTLEHPYHEIAFGDVARVFRDPATQQGLNLFVDARKAELFEEGHIPGAMHCDAYELGAALEEVVARANGVERVIVYCGGGDCEDSIFLCRELIEAGASYDDVFLYAGGFKEWVARGMSVDTGSTQP